MRAMIEETEEQLQSMAPLLRRMVVAGVPLLIVLAGWYFFLDPIFTEAQQVETKIAETRKKLASLKTPALRSRIRKIERKIPALRSEIERYRQELAFVESAAQNLPRIWFDDKRYLELLQGMLNRSVALSLRVDEVAEQDETPKWKAALPVAAVAPFKTVTVTGAGSFANIVRLANYCESFDMPLRIEEMTVERDRNASTSRPLFTLKIRLYGVRR